jgi:hypothetical protein
MTKEIYTESEAKVNPNSRLKESKIKALRLRKTTSTAFQIPDPRSQIPTSKSCCHRSNANTS